jgi:hypothetical protein
MPAGFPVNRHVPAGRWPGGDSFNLKDSGRSVSPSISPGFWVSFADRDLLFRDCQVVAGTGASAGSFASRWVFRFVMNLTRVHGAGDFFVRKA